MNINFDKPWLKNYPEGVSSNINFDEYSSLVDMFEKTCNRFSSNKAFTNFGVSFTFKEIYQKSTNLASFFQNELNLSQGSRVAIMMPNILQYPISTFGILKAGLIVDNINPLYTSRELEIQLIDSKSETIFALTSNNNVKSNKLHFMNEPVIALFEASDNRKRKKSPPMMPINLGQNLPWKFKLYN